MWEKAVVPLILKFGEFSKFDGISNLKKLMANLAETTLKIEKWEN